MTSTRRPATALILLLLSSPLLMAMQCVGCGGDDTPNNPDTSVDTRVRDTGRRDGPRDVGRKDSTIDAPDDALRLDTVRPDTTRADTTRDGPQPTPDTTRDGPQPTPDTTRDTGTPTPDTTRDSGGTTIPGTFVTIAAGSFTMGSPSTQTCADPAEERHQVTLTHSFEIMTTETTQAWFQSVLGYNPSFFDKCGSTCPVESINWHMAVAYCNALSTRAGLTKCYTCTGSGSNVSCQPATAYTGQGIYTCPGYRLPTEAEWEYAYRAGTTTTFYSGNNDQSKCYTCTSLDPNADKIGWYCGNTAVTYAGCADLSGSGGPTCAGPHPVASKQANPWGLYDMSGNLWEWVHDRWKEAIGTTPVTDPVIDGAGTARNLRGGSWFLDADLLRGAYRKHLPDTIVDYNLGVRCARTK